MSIRVCVKRVGSVEVPLPKYQTSGSAGFDLHAAIEDPIKLYPKGGNGGIQANYINWTLIPVGLAFEIPPGFEGQIRPRSGLALKNGISIVNTPGTIDSDYRGDLSVILINLGNETFIINPLDRIAQMIICPVVQAELLLVENLNDTIRGDGGFGSTGGFIKHGA
jgi:dUTP pyrophosphatase